MKFRERHTSTSQAKPFAPYKPQSAEIPISISIPKLKAKVKGTQSRLLHPRFPQSGGSKLLSLFSPHNNTTHSAMPVPGLRRASWASKCFCPPLLHCCTAASPPCLTPIFQVVPLSTTRPSVVTMKSSSLTREMVRVPRRPPFTTTTAATLLTSCSTYPYNFPAAAGRRLESSRTSDLYPRA